MDAEKVAFWGIVLKPGDPADLDLDDGETLRVTTASYGEELSDKTGRSVITASVRPDDDAEPRKFAVAVLTAGRTETVTMDVAFVGEEKVTFQVSGKNSVHLVGNFSFENDLEEDDSDEEDEENHLIGLYDDAMESESEDDEEKEQGTVKLIKEDKPIITELSDEDEENNKEKDKVRTGKKKKGKRGGDANGGADPAPTKKVSEASATPIAKSQKSGSEKEGDEKAAASENDGPLKSASKGRRKKSGHKKGLTGGSESSAAEKDTDMKDLQEAKADGGNKTVTRSAMKKISDPNKAASSGDEGNKEGDHEDDADETPKKGRKRRRKHNVTVETPEQGPSPPSGKKSKVSQRPATPAPSKSAAHVKSLAAHSEKANGQTELNGKAEEAKENGASTPSLTPGSSKKRRKPKKKRAA